MQDLYTQTNLQVRLGKLLSASFRTRSGIRQGCVLAPALFCKAMDCIMDRAMSHRGVMISGENIPDSDYADDIAALEGDLADITGILESSEAAGSELGLHISWAKTKVQSRTTCIKSPGQWSNCGGRAELRFFLAASSTLQMALDPSSFVALG